MSLDYFATGFSKITKKDFRSVAIEYLLNVKWFNQRKTNTEFVLLASS